MVEKKGIYWLVWVGGGCVLLMVFVVVIFVGLGVFVVKKVFDVVIEIVDNLVQMMVKVYVLVNFEVEFV